MAADDEAAWMAMTGAQSASSSTRDESWQRQRGSVWRDELHASMEAASSSTASGSAEALPVPASHPVAAAPPRDDLAACVGVTKDSLKDSLRRRSAASAALDDIDGELDTRDFGGSGLLGNGPRDRTDGTLPRRIKLGACDFPAGAPGDGLSADADDSGSEGPGEDLDGELDMPEPPSRGLWKSVLGIFFTFIFVGPTAVGLYMHLENWLDPPVRTVAVGDAEAVKSILFGGKPWLVSCVTQKGASNDPSKTLLEAAELLRSSGVRTARVPCWEPLATRQGPRTLAQKFRFRDRPPIAMVTTGSGKPQLLSLPDSGVTGKSLHSKAIKAIKNREGAGPSISGISGPAIGRSKEKRNVDIVGRRPKDMESDDLDPIGGVDESEIVDDEAVDLD